MELECFTLFDPDSLFLYLSSKFKNIQIKALYQNYPQPQFYPDSTPNSSLFNLKFTPSSPQFHPDPKISIVINSKYGLLVPVYIIYFQTNVCRL